MRKKLLKTLSAFLALMLITSCSKEAEEMQIDGNGDSEIEETNIISSICGVWEDTENELFFLGVSKNGEVTFCLNRYAIGKGYGELIGNKLTINNNYTGNIDELTLYVLNNGSIKISGKVQQYKSDIKTSINLTLTKTNEIFISSFAGEFWKPLSGLNIIYGSVQSTLSFVNDDYAQYKFYVEKTGEILKEQVWHYIPRKWIKIEGGLTRTVDIVYIHSSNQTDSSVRVYDYELNNDLLADY